MWGEVGGGGGEMGRRRGGWGIGEEERGGTGGAYSMNHGPTTMSGVFHFVAAYVGLAVRLHTSVGDLQLAVRRCTVLLVCVRGVGSHQTVVHNAPRRLCARVVRGVALLVRNNISLVYVVLPAGCVDTVRQLSASEEGGLFRKNSANCLLGTLQHLLSAAVFSVGPVFVVCLGLVLFVPTRVRFWGFYM